MLSSEVKRSFLSIIRLGIGHDAYFSATSVDWDAIAALASLHGLSAIMVDGVEKVSESLRPPKTLLLQWIGEVLHSYEQRYELYKKTIAEMAEWHNAHDYKMMVIKGYTCSLDWPKPNHRSCGDIDIWQFGQQEKADLALSKEKGIKIDKEHHHHTVFFWGDFMVENHFDFLNVHHHKSNVTLEAILKELGQDDSHYIDLNGERVYLPSPNLHALFLLRHAMSNFASTGMQLRQLLDWAFLVEKHGKEIDWDWLIKMIDLFGMKPLYQVFNAICIEDFGFSPRLFQSVHFEPGLKERVLNDIISPEFEKKESGGFIRRAFFKYRRWKANAWKHELCFNDSLESAFWSGVKSHFLKPSSI